MPKTNKSLQILIPLLLILLIGCKQVPTEFIANPSCSQIEKFNYSKSVILFVDDNETKVNILKDEAFLKEIKEGYNFIIITKNAKCKTVADLEKKFQIEYYPTIISTNDEGKEIYRAINFDILEGELPYKHLFKETEYHLSYFSEQHKDLNQQKIDSIEDGYWLTTGNITIFDKSITNENYVYLGYTGGGLMATKNNKEYFIEKEAVFDIYTKWKRKNKYIFDWYINNNNKMICYEIDAVEKETALIPKIKTDTLNFISLNKNEFILKKDKMELKFVRDTTRLWKTFE